jgi:hypothetical protein
LIYVGGLDCDALDGAFLQAETTILPRYFYAIAAETPIGPLPLWAFPDGHTSFAAG